MDSSLLRCFAFSKTEADRRPGRTSLRLAVRASHAWHSARMGDRGVGKGEVPFPHRAYGNKASPQARTGGKPAESIKSQSSLKIAILEIHPRGIA